MRDCKASRIFLMLSFVSKIWTGLFSVEWSRAEFVRSWQERLEQKLTARLREVSSVRGSMSRKCYEHIQKSLQI